MNVLSLAGGSGVGIFDGEGVSDGKILRKGGEHPKL